MKKYIPAVFTMLVVMGCKTKHEEVPCTYTGNDSGTYTATDYQGQATSTVDANDWTSDATWNDCENALFSGSDSLNYSALTLDSVGIAPVFPNPFATTLQMHTQARGKGLMKYSVVDDKFGVKYSGPLAVDSGGHTVLLNMALDSGKMYRMYYQFYGLNKTVVLKGHGDLKVTN